MNATLEFIEDLRSGDGTSGGGSDVYGISDIIEGLDRVVREM